MGQLCQRGRIGILLASLCFLLGAPASASAECAWVLWVHTEDKGLRGWWDGPKWTPRSAFASKKECEDPLGIRSKGAPGDDPLDIRSKQSWICLPDTVDPRGPKGTK